MGLHERIIEDLTTQAREEGMKKGITEGEARGEAKGIEIAKKQGIRKALQKSTLSIEDIADLFEVSVQYVREIQQQMK